MNKRYLLDTSAILALRSDEPGADDVESILRESESGQAEVYASFMTYMEVYYRIWHIEGEESAKRMYGELLSLPISRVDMSDSILLCAGSIKANYSLSVADAWIIASAIEMEASLVHKDPEFEQVQDIVSLIFLPYKQRDSMS
ncbi:PIN domain-containing protein [Candidatus Poribacteria bacterium]